jgi:hypothetical protein
MQWYAGSPTDHLPKFVELGNVVNGKAVMGVDLRDPKSFINLIS